MLAAPALLIALTAPLVGLLTDRLARVRFLAGSAVLYGLAALSGLLADGLGALLAGRALLGVAAAGVMTTATALAGDLFAGGERDRFMGWQAAFSGAGGLVFLTLGGLLADASWRAPFLLYGLALPLAPAVLLFLREPRGARGATGDGTGTSAAGEGAARLGSEAPTA